MTVISLIAAMDRKHAIGKDNTLPWHLPDDLKRFKAMTLGKPVLMGRKTAESLGRALPGRPNWVLTRSGQVPFEGMQPLDSLAAALALAQDYPELCVIGGGDVFALTLPIAQRLHLTYVDTEVVAADAFFPDFNPADWHLTASSRHQADARHAFNFEFADYSSISAA